MKCETQPVADTFPAIAKREGEGLRQLCRRELLNNALLASCLGWITIDRQTAKDSRPLWSSSSMKCWKAESTRKFSQLYAEVGIYSMIEPKKSPDHPADEVSCPWHLFFFVVHSTGLYT